MGIKVAPPFGDRLTDCWQELMVFLSADTPSVIVLVGLDPDWAAHHLLTEFGHDWKVVKAGLEAGEECLFRDASSGRENEDVVKICSCPTRKVLPRIGS
eukprot:817959-Rhodomonas_salina.3